MYMYHDSVLTSYFTGSVNCIMRKRVYRGRLHYLPEDEEPNAEAQLTSGIEQPTGENSQQELESAAKEEPAEEEQATADVTYEVEEVHKQEEKPAVDSHLQNKGDERGGASTGIDIPGQPSEPLGAHVYPSSYNQAVETPIEEPTGQGRATHEAQLVQDEEEVREKPIAPTGPPSTLLPRTLSDPVPANWKTVETDFLMFAALLVSHMSKDFIGAPGKCMGTGTARITYLTQELSRLDLLRFFTSADTQKWLESNNVPAINTRAYRLEPITSPGMLTIDGEVVEFGPIQVQVHKHMGRVMCRKRKPSGSATE